MGKQGSCILGGIIWLHHVDVDILQDQGRRGRSDGLVPPMGESLITRVPVASTFYKMLSIGRIFATLKWMTDTFRCTEGGSTRTKKYCSECLVYWTPCVK